MTEKMKAVVFTAPGKAELTQIPRPEPTAGEIVVRIEGCGVCASTIPVWEGRPWFNYPAAPGSPGHEGWGRVAAVGEGVTTLLPGDRVTFLSNNAYAEYEKVPASVSVLLPKELDGIPFPGEPVGCGMNVFRRSDVQPGQTVAIIGAGFLGIIFTALAVNSGARVIAISRRQFALDVARTYGAAETVLLDDHQRVLKRVNEIAGPNGCDRVVEATGYQWPLDLAGELVRERGKLVIAGYHQDGPRQVNLQQWNWKGLDVINAHERDPALYLEGMREGIATIASGIVTMGDLLTHTFTLDRIAEAYRLLEQRPEGFIKGIVTA